MSTKVEIAIQFVNYQTKDYLIRAIKTVLADIGDDQFTVVINILDNNSEDLSLVTEVFADATVPIKIYYAQENLGFGRGHNYLASKTQADFIILANPDIELIQKNTIQRLLAGFTDESIGAVGPKLLTADGKDQAFDHGEADGLLAKAADYFGESYWRSRSEPATVNWVAATFLMVRRGIFEESGGFDEKFFLYQEDEELCWRMRVAGYKVWYLPEVMVRHQGSVVAKFDRKFMEPAKRYYLKKRFGHKRLRYLLLQAYLFLRYKVF